MKRRFQGLSSTAQANTDVPDGVFLVRVDQVRYSRERQMPFYTVRFSVLEPGPLAGSTLSGRLYCTHYKKGAPFEVGCGCCHEQSTTPDERNTRWTV
jgi:hypothetical protein